MVAGRDRHFRTSPGSRSGADLEKALEEKEALINAIHHRLRNTLQVVSSILHLQTTCLTDPAARRAIRATELQILSLALAHEDLYRSQYPDRVRMEEYLTRLTGTLLGSYGVPPEKIAWKVRAPGIEMHLELAQFIGFLLTELVVNVIQHAFLDGMTGTMEVTIDRSRAAGIPSPSGTPGWASRGDAHNRNRRSRPPHRPAPRRGVPEGHVQSNGAVARR